jgi:hypothetical protein
VSSPRAKGGKPARGAVVLGVKGSPIGRGACPAGRVDEGRSAFDEPNFSGAGSFAGFFLRELDALTFPQQLEDRSAYRAAMEEMFDSAFIADESETFVDQKASDRPGRHTRVLR